jgi:hypothetical protein
VTSRARRRGTARPALCGLQVVEHHNIAAAQAGRQAIADPRHVGPAHGDVAPASHRPARARVIGPDRHRHSAVVLPPEFAHRAVGRLANHRPQDVEIDRARPAAASRLRRPGLPGGSRLHRPYRPAPPAEPRGRNTSRYGSTATRSTNRNAASTGSHGSTTTALPHRALSPGRRGWASVDCGACDCVTLSVGTKRQECRQ